MNLIKNKLGELTSKQLITIIILIISFVIILLFFFVLNPGSEAAQQACKNSVALRGTELGEATKLECKTQQICISGGEECEYSSKDVRTIRVKDREEILSALSDLMYDCWWMMGEGKVDYAPRGYGFEEKYCHICNTIKFDEVVKENENWNTIGMKELYYYLQNKRIKDNDQSYLYFLYKVNSLDGVQKKIYEDTDGELDIYARAINLNKFNEYALITGVTKQGYGKAIVVGAVGAAAGIAIGVAFPPAAAASYPTALAAMKYAATLWKGTQGAAAAGGVGLYVTDGNIQALPPYFTSFNAQEIENLKCNAFTSVA